ncbi:hypothetical protein FQR65_LT02728 [Abscondita terminalis]|nr:hypothetical protein FQR65_LT02728 [Abscondita terminalis]
MASNHGRFMADCAKAHGPKCDPNHQNKLGVLSKEGRVLMQISLKDVVFNWANACENLSANTLLEYAIKNKD